MKPQLSTDGVLMNARGLTCHLERVSPRWNALNRQALDCDMSAIETWEFMALSLGLDVAEQERKNEEFRKAIFGDEDDVSIYDDPPCIFMEPPSRVVPILLTGLGLAAAIGAGACLMRGHGEASVVAAMVAIACGMRAFRTPV